jgi:hypothetical protein
MTAAMSSLGELEQIDDTRVQTHSVSTKESLPLVPKGYSSSSNNFGHRGLDFLRK